jgi:hypothetical protein
MCWESRNTRRERRDVAGEVRFGGSGGRIFSVPLTRRPPLPVSLFVVSGLERPLWGGNGSGRRTPYRDARTKNRFEGRG